MQLHPIQKKKIMTEELVHLTLKNFQLWRECSKGEFEIRFRFVETVKMHLKDPHSSKYFHSLNIKGESFYLAVASGKGFNKSLSISS